jgi:protein tyrosine phosphatase (PTP) superfamily phosphohydrolase (DUF442 family)
VKPAAALAAPLILVLGGSLARRRWLIAQLQGRLQALPQPLLPTPSFCDGEAASALARLNGADLVLLCAARADEDASTQARQAFLREQLHAAGVAYGVLHGEDAAIVQQAWQALQSALGLAQQTDDAQPTAEARSLATWRSNCEKCSDPVCEHRLFSDLVGQRAQA